MLWTEFHVESAAAGDVLRAALGAALGVPEAWVQLVDDPAQIDRAAPVCCERRGQPGGFPWRLTLYLRDYVATPRDPAVTAAALCREVGGRALVSDDEVDPYVWRLVSADGRVEHVGVDPAALDATGAFVLTGPRAPAPPRERVVVPGAHPYRGASAPTAMAPPPLRAGEEGNLHAVLAVYNSGIMALPWGPPRLLLHWTLGLGALASVARQVDPYRAFAHTDPRVRQAFGGDRPRGAVVAVDNAGGMVRRELAPEQIGTLLRAFQATGLPATPLALEVSDNKTGEWGYHLSFTGACGGVAFAVEYGGLEPFTLAGPRAAAWSAFLDALYEAAGSGGEGVT